MAVECKYDPKTNKITITMDALTEPRESSSGKTMVLGSTQGNQSTTAQYNGRPLIVGANVYFKP